jgi:hypothetical protein
MAKAAIQRLVTTEAAFTEGSEYVSSQSILSWPQVLL